MLAACNDRFEETSPYVHPVRSYVRKKLRACETGLTKENQVKGIVESSELSQYSHQRVIHSYLIETSLLLIIS